MDNRHFKTTIDKGNRNAKEKKERGPKDTGGRNMRLTTIHGRGKNVRKKREKGGKKPEISKKV